MIAAALLKALCFLFVALLNLILPPSGGTFLVLLTSLYVGYDPMAGPISVIIGTLYSLIAGGGGRARQRKTVTLNRLSLRRRLSYNSRMEPFA